MVILRLYDELNGYRYRKFTLSYYERNANSPLIVEAWIVPNTNNSDNDSLF